MPTWEEMKRAGQRAFISQETELPALPENTAALYQQITTTGDVYPLMGRESLTRQIANDQFPSPETQQPEISRSVEQEQDIEPER